MVACHQLRGFHSTARTRRFIETQRFRQTGKVRMKSLAKFILSLALIAPFGANADTPPSTPAPSESQLVEHGSYINKDGIRVHSPAHTKNDDPACGCVCPMPCWELHLQPTSPRNVFASSYALSINQKLKAIACHTGPTHRPPRAATAAVQTVLISEERSYLFA